MPYAIRKVRNQPCYKVYNKTTKKIYAKCTTRERAEGQVRLLRGIENNRKFAKQVRERRMTMKKRK
jgi:hypothetical protein